CLARRGSGVRSSSAPPILGIFLRIVQIKVLCGVFSSGITRRSLKKWVNKEVTQATCIEQ
ncbi:hypothetical protein, partial [Legionella cincinnatiensis]|uniref:hypothetical protein n=1 Tax=Legionella cincinnatiensis TaxID=28085 RepID=UPI001A940371